MNVFKLHIPIIGLVALLTACLGAKQAAVVEADQNQEVKSDVNIETIVLPGSDKIFASIERTACFGTCPVYKLTIYIDGTVILDGRHFWTKDGDVDSSRTGWFKGMIEQSDLQLISEKAIELGFFKLLSHYPSGGITDLPSTTTYLNLNGIEKTVLNENYNVPRVVFDFENYVDSFQESANLKRVKVQNNK